MNRGALPKVPTVTVRPINSTKTWLAKPACWEPGEAFTFLNEKRTYPEKVEWEQAGAGKLWLYNLHYFDCLNAQSALSSEDNTHSMVQSAEYQESCSRLIEDWITQNPGINGNGWEPYPTSLRIVNWIKWHVHGPGLSEVALNSLALQTQWLSTRLEHHILANHLFTNVKALVFAGLFFEGRQAKKWLHKGTSLVNNELAEQILSDGAHFELTPMYHSILLEDVLDMLNLAKAAADVVAASTLAAWVKACERMLYWQSDTVHPDGEFAFFNDTAFGIARTHNELCDYAKRIGVSSRLSPAQSTYLEASGFGILREGQFTVIADVGVIGPEYQPGHAHADSLSCEVSFDSDRVFVNAGTSTYVKGELRDWQRSTAAHNTLELAGENSSDVWDGFRVARRAYTQNVEWTNNDKHTQLQAQHNGYRFLPDKPHHTRQWQLDAQELQVIDSIVNRQGQRIGLTGVSATIRWLLHPSVMVLSASRLRTASGHELLWHVDSQDVEMQPATWYPEFGMAVTTQCIVINTPVRCDFEVKLTLRAESV